MSNAERQRKFRAANPGYFNKYNNRRKALRIAAQKKMLALFKELAKAKVAAMQQQAATPVMAKTPLMLPAPVRDPAMEAIDALAAKLKCDSAAAAASLPLSTPTCSADQRRAA